MLKYFIVLLFIVFFIVSYIYIDPSDVKYHQEVTEIIPKIEKDTKSPLVSIISTEKPNDIIIFEPVKTNSLKIDGESIEIKSLQEESSQYTDMDKEFQEIVLTLNEIENSKNSVNLNDTQIIEIVKNFLGTPNN